MHRVTLLTGRDGGQIRYQRRFTDMKLKERIQGRDTVPAVTILCLTYNHEKFIRGAMEGFLEQETSFPVEILIHDDASTDRTLEILEEYQRNYPTIVKIHREKKNQWSQTQAGFLIKSLRGIKTEFVAICEGDDYWVDVRKLQIQYEKMLQNPGVSLCCTRYKVLKDGEISDAFALEGWDDQSEKTVNFENWTNPYILKTLTSFFRLSALRARLAEIPWSRHFKDIFLFCLLLDEGDALVLGNCTSVYRVHPQCVWSMKSDLEKSRANIRTGWEMYRYFKGKKEIFSFLQGNLHQGIIDATKAGKLGYVLLYRTMLARIRFIDSKKARFVRTHT